VPSSAPPEPSLSAEEKAAFERGISELNSGFFFECHDTLEDLWAGVRGPSRDFFQGLIQVAVGCYHLTRDNPTGARRLFERAMGRLEAYPDAYGSVALGELRRAVLALAAALGRGEDVAPALPLVRRVAPDASRSGPAEEAGPR